MSKYTTDKYIITGIIILVIIFILVPIFFFVTIKSGIKETEKVEKNGYLGDINIARDCSFNQCKEVIMFNPEKERGHYQLGGSNVDKLKKELEEKGIYKKLQEGANLKIKIWGKFSKSSNRPDADIELDKYEIYEIVKY